MRRRYCCLGYRHLFNMGDKVKKLLCGIVIGVIVSVSISAISGHRRWTGCRIETWIGYTTAVGGKCLEARIEHLLDRIETLEKKH